MRFFFGKNSRSKGLKKTLRANNSHIRLSMMCLALWRNRYIASGSEDGSIAIWNLHTGRCLEKLKGHKDCIYSLIGLPDGRLASGSGDMTIKIWNIRSGKCEKTLEGHQKEVFTLVALPEGRLASGSSNGAIKVWNISSGKYEITLSQYNLIKLIVFSSGQFASVSLDNFIQIWDLESGEPRENKELRPFPYDQTVALAVLPEDRLAAGFAEGNIKLWNVHQDPKWIISEKKLGDHEECINQLISLPGSRLAATSDENIKIWNIKSEKCEKELVGHKSFIRDLMLLPDQQLASCSEDGTIKIWDVSNRQKIFDHKGYSSENESLCTLF